MRTLTVLGLLLGLTSPAMACWQAPDGTRIMMGLDDGLEDEEALIFAESATEDCALANGEETAPDLGSVGYIQTFYCPGRAAETAVVIFGATPAMAFRGVTFRACD